MDNQLRTFDNLNARVADDLKSRLAAGSRLSIAAASFSLYAYEALRKELEQIDELRFLFTSPTFSPTGTTRQQREFYIPKLHRERNLYGNDFELRLRNQLTQRAVARECADWIRRKVRFKSNLTSGRIDGFCHLQQGGEEYLYQPFNEFTTTELGCEQGNNLCPMVVGMPAPMAHQYLQKFDELWADSERFQEVTEAVLESIENVYRENAPQFIYFITLYHIFHEFLADLSDDQLPNEATGFKQSAIWNKLYQFQKDACLAIINKLEKYNGCILADSVGLGKTFTALGVVKYYENRNKSVLVLCPKKLNDNWITYRSNYKNNPIATDRLRYDILFHSDLSRSSGSTNGLDLNHINWANYDLVVIDESHNFRNGGKVTTDEHDENPRENRYLQLLNRVIRPGVKTKVLMLSATPVNNRFNDLKNQIALAYEGESEQMDELLHTETGIDDIFRQAQAAYNRWSRLLPAERTTQRLLDSLNFDFFEVLDSVTIARSRKHIEQYYPKADVGRFPTRLKPLSRRPHLTDVDTQINYNQVYTLLQQLNLAIYTPSEFILPSLRDKYRTKRDDDLYAGLTMAGRENGLRKLMSTNLLKRMESSVNSFRLTVSRISDYIQSVRRQIAQLDEGHSMVAAEDGMEWGWDADDAESLYVGGRKTQIDLRDMDYIRWENYLREDEETLRRLLNLLLPVTPEHDCKLQQLIADLYHKLAHPINPGNRKVIIFTAFSDTAQYLYDHLSQRILKTTGLHTALVTGDVEARTTLRLRQHIDFNTLLTLFSPRSKERDALFPTLTQEIDILIATDCISEGQNLQDCDYLINYDIHWNPVRIIQRFGRIDRIGSQNESIQLVNFWPDMTLDEYIDLKGRVEARMKVSVMTATGDDNPLTNEEKGDLEYRREQLRRLQEEVVDIEEMNSGISIMDLGLNEFRLDLLEYLKRHADVEHTPLGLHAVVGATPESPPGTLFVLKNRNNSINIDRKNRLHPFYLVYIRDDESIYLNHLQPKELLDRMRMLCKQLTKPCRDLCQEFNRQTHDGKRMNRYNELLQKAIQSIVQVKEQSDLDCFLGGVQGTLFTDELKGLDDFELICFLVIQ